MSRYLLSLLVLLAMVGAAWSQETPPAEIKPVEAAKDASPKFSATLLLVKADWSDSPYAKAIEAELRDALKDASVPKELLDQLPASGPEILFGPQTVALYSEEHHAELIAWLKAKELILSQEKFDKAPVPPKKEAEAKARATAEQYLATSDSNKDGVLAKEEWLRFGGAYYRTADLDKDGVLSLAELTAHIEKEQRLWAENTIKLSKDDRFIELPKTGVGKRPFVKSQADLLWRVYWSIPGAGGPESVSFSRQITVRDQLRGQEAPAEGRLVDNAYASVHIKEGRVLVMNAFPVPSESEFRQAARAKGFEAVVMIGRALEKVPEAPARVHAPDWIDDRGDFGHEPKLAWRGDGRASSPTSSFGSSGGEANREPRFPEFTAALMLVKSDWSKSPDAKRIEADLREALKDAAVPQELLDRLPASATDTLFGPDSVSFYTPEEYASLLAWLRARSLLISTEPFPGIKKVTTQEGKPGWEMPELNKGDQFIVLPRPRQAAQPFIVRKPELVWTIYPHGRDLSEEKSVFTIGKHVRVQEKSRGQEQPSDVTFLNNSSLRFDFPADHVAVMNAFPAASDNRFRAAASAKGFTALVVLVGAKELPKEADPKLALPAQVKAIIAEHSSKMDWDDLESTRVAPAKFSDLPDEPEAGLTKIFHLQHASASELREVLLQLAAADIKLVVDERTNVIIVSGSAASLAELEAIALRLDEPGSAAEGKGPAPKPAGTIAELKQQYADAEREAARLAKESKPAKDKLRAAVAQAFELRQKLLQAELAEFRGRTERIEKSLQQREGIKQQIIERRVEDLLKPGLEWEGAEAKPATSSAKSVEPPKPSPEQTARRDGAKRLQEFELREAEVRLRVAETELAGAVTANKKTPNTVPQKEVRRLQAELDIAKLGVEKARAMLELVQNADANGSSAYSSPVDRATQIKLLELDVKQANLELEATQANYSQREKRAAAGLINDSELAEAKIALTRAEAKLQKSVVLLEAARQTTSPDRNGTEASE